VKFVLAVLVFGGKRSGKEIIAFGDIIAMAEIKTAPLWGVGGIFAPSASRTCIFVLYWQRASFCDCFIGCPVLLRLSVFFPFHFLLLNSISVTNLHYFMLSFTCHVSAESHIRSKDSKPFEFFLVATLCLIPTRLCVIEEFNKFSTVFCV